MKASQREGEPTRRLIKSFAQRAYFLASADPIFSASPDKPAGASDGRSLSQRYDDWHNGFIVPKEKLDTVFQCAIKECRVRTLAHLSLPPNESFTVEYVTHKPWGGYNWYKGNYQSVIQINTDLPVYIERAVDLAAHEGYPGHHVYNTLLEKNLTRGRGWVEFSCLPLYAPQALVSGRRRIRDGRPFLRERSKP